MDRETCFRADLHNHSCLSPCGSLDLSPSVLVSIAAKKGIRLLALTDHNCARNLPAFEICCRNAGITPIFGIEITTEEEVDVIALFGDLSPALQLGAEIEALLPPIQNDPDLFGDQVYVNEGEQILGEVENLLTLGAAVSYFDLIPDILSRGGLAVPAHIDRPHNGAVSQLGFLPDIPYSAVEVMHRPPPFECWGNTVITGSDAHYPEHVGRRYFEVYDIKKPDFPNLMQALAENRVYCR